MSRPSLLFGILILNLILVRSSPPPIRDQSLRPPHFQTDSRRVRFRPGRRRRGRRAKGARGRIDGVEGMDWREGLIGGYNSGGDGLISEYCSGWTLCPRRRERTREIRCCFRRPIDFVETSPCTGVARKPWSPCSPLEQSYCPTPNLYSIHLPTRSSDLSNRAQRSSLSHSLALTFLQLRPSRAPAVADSQHLIKSTR